jgi:hypothetical protein
MISAYCSGWSALSWSSICGTVASHRRRRMSIVCRRVQSYRAAPARLQLHTPPGIRHLPWSARSVECGLLLCSECDGR